MKLTPFLLGSLLAAGCSTPFQPEPLHPSPERMQELLNAPVKSVKKMNLPFEIVINPRIQAFPGSDAWVTCYVPERFGSGRIRFGLEGVQTSEGPLDHTQNRLLIHNLPCGELVATCAISTAQGIQTAPTQTLNVTGGLCGTNP